MTKITTNTQCLICNKKSKLIMCDKCAKEYRAKLRAKDKLKPKPKTYWAGLGKTGNILFVYSARIETVKWAKALEAFFQDTVKIKIIPVYVTKKETNG